MRTSQQRTVIYTAMSKHSFYARMQVTTFVLRRGLTPLNPFALWGYFLDDMVERDLIRQANDDLVRRVDGVWVFGPISNGVAREVAIARAASIPVRFFSIADDWHRIREVGLEEIALEPGLSGRDIISGAPESRRMGV